MSSRNGGLEVQDQLKWPFTVRQTVLSQGLDSDETEGSSLFCRGFATVPISLKPGHHA
jgi:hypothetical protein